MVVAGFSGGEAEELRRAMGFKRSVKRMQQIEQRLRDGMARNGIHGTAADDIVRSITSFALYGFPESHAASFALIVYASAYLKAHYPAAFYTALLNNQPMGFYHPATLVKDAQRRGVRFTPVDVQVSSWNCRIEENGAIRLGLRIVKGLRADAGQHIEKAEGKRQKAEGEEETGKNGERGTGNGERMCVSRPSMIWSRVPGFDRTKFACWPSVARWRRSVGIAGRRSGKRSGPAARPAHCSSIAMKPAVLTPKERHPVSCPRPQVPSLKPQARFLPCPWPSGCSRTTTGRG